MIEASLIEVVIVDWWEVSACHVAELLPDFLACWRREDVVVFGSVRWLIARRPCEDEADEHAPGPTGGGR